MKLYRRIKKNILFQIQLKIESLYSYQKIFILIDGLDEIERIDKLANGYCCALHVLLYISTHVETTIQL